MVRLRLRRLQIDKYRNVVPGTVLDFNDGMNVLLGPNGSGKTTLLRLIAAVVRDDFELFAEEELDITYQVELLSELVLRVRLANRRSSAHGRRINTAGDGPDWEFQIIDASNDRLVLEGNPFGVKERLWETACQVRDPMREAGPLRLFLDILDAIVTAIKDEAAESKQTEKVHESSILSRFVTDASNFQISLLLQGRRFDEGLGIFSAIVGGQSALDIPDYCSYASLSRGGEVSGVSGWFLPEDLQKAVEALPREGNGSDITLTDASLPFLKRVVDLFGAQQAKMILRLHEKTEDGEETFNDFESLFTLDDGSTIRHDLLSWGQKRILSFFYYAAANPDVLVVDELVNGLHHEWITACLKEMEGRQCFLTSQNPLLLDHLTFGSVEDVQRTFIQCRREKGEKRAQLHWHPVDEASAESFYRAYRAGIQHVGELLRVKGLW